MDKDLRRALRRHHVARLKRVRQWYWSYSAKTPTQLGMLVATPTPCSCWMCGNPRRKRWLSDLPKGLTLQEVKHRDIERSYDGDSVV